MMQLMTDRRGRWTVFMVMALACWPAAGSAQGIGSGPLTSSLATTEPQTGILRVGRFRLAPGVVVREIGWDSNVFDEAVDPKADYVAAIAPDVSVFLGLRFLQLSAYGGGDFNYYQTYESERSAGYATRARIDFLLSRLRPFVGAGRTQIRTRPNGEIDVRANRREDELSGGLAFDLSAHSQVYVSAFQHTIEFRNSVEDGVDLSAALNRDSYDYSAGFRTDLTPLTSLNLSASYREDKFRAQPFRNGDTRLATAALRMGAEAIVSGVVSVSFRDYKSADPNVRPYRGLTALGSLSYSFLEVGRLNLTGSRSLDYSFDAAEAYFIENTLALTYTHRLFGEIDAQARAGKSFFDYGHSEITPPHTDELDTLGASLGYNLRNRTRVSLNYELARRRSPAFTERNYDRTRVYLAWTYAL